ncbi:MULTISPECIES: ATP-dependent protease subunit HslV [Cysteiniphilum]|uniref:ATP-dependent protease subunit HslV n=1 Tax=Cysteiniphilum TaxID=2056696 RepID=UPI0017858EAA|nr:MULTISPECIES: ATP-dependent protease subunit HslV [Cysteiniphilum]
MLEMKGTTILCVRRGDEVVIGGDGQATLGNTVAKDNIIKVRKLSNGKVLTGFAGSTADAFTLFEKFEQKLDFYQGNLERASVEMVREWRLDRMMSKLEAMIIVADENKSLLISGVGDVMAADEKGILSIGSGSAFAKAAAHALVDNTDLSASDIVKKSLNIAADICIYTNHNLTIEKLANKAAV